MKISKKDKNYILILSALWLIVALIVAFYLQADMGMSSRDALRSGLGISSVVIAFAVVLNEIFHRRPKRQSYSLNRSDSFFRGWNMVGIALLFPFVAVFRFHYLNKGMNPDTALRAGLYWGSIWYCILVVGTAWRFFSAKSGGVYQNRFANPLTAITEAELTEMTLVPKGVYPVFQGIHFIPWHWKLVQKLNMESEGELSETITIFDMDKLSGTVKVFANATPIRGIWAVNVLRVPRKLAMNMLTTAIVGEIQSYFGANYRFLDNAVARLPEIVIWARNNVLGGSRKLSLLEKIVGLFLGEISFQDLKPGETAQKILVARTKIETFKTTYESVRKEPGMDDNIAVSIACAAADIDPKYEQAIIKNIGNRNDPFLNTEVLREAQHSSDSQHKK